MAVWTILLGAVRPFVVAGARKWLAAGEEIRLIELIDDEFPETELGGALGMALREDDDLAVLIHRYITRGFLLDAEDLATRLDPYLYGGDLRSSQAMAAALAEFIIEEAPRATRTDRDATNRQARAITQHFDETVGPLSAEVRAIRDMLSKQTADTPRPSGEDLARGPRADPTISRDLERANEVLAKDPLEAARLFHQSAEALRSRGFAPDADALEEEAREALVAGGAISEAFDSALDAASTGAPQGPAQSLLAHSLRELVARLGEGDVRSLRHEAFDAWSSWAEAPEHLEPLRTAVAKLRQRGDSMLPQAALWLGEALVVDRRQPPTADDIETLEAAVAEATGQHRLRLRMATADLTEADGSWQDLEGEVATGSHGALECAWIASRAGRHHLRAGNTADARHWYLRAVELAHTAGRPGAVGAALIDLANVHLAEGDLETGQSLWRRARAVPEGDAFLPAAGGRLVSAVTALAEGKAETAHAPLRGMLWEAVVQGQRTDERRIHRLLGGMYERADEWELAAWHYQQASEVKKARLAMARTREGEMPRPVTQEPGERAAARAALSAVADRMPEQEARELCDELLEDLDFPWPSPLVANVAVEAAQALAASTLLLSEPQLIRALEVLEQTVERPEGQHNLFDEAHAQLLVVAYAAYPAERPRIGETIARGLAQDGLGPMLIRRMARMGAGEVELRDALRERGDLEVSAIRRALEALDDPVEPSDEEAIQAARRILERPAALTRTSWSIGEGIGISQAEFDRLSPNRKRAVLRKLMQMALDTAELEMSRGQAIRAYVGLSASSPELRSGDVFATLIELANPEVELSRIDQQHRQSRHPLSRFRFSIGQGELRAAAVEAAAFVARGPQQSAWAVTLLRIAAAAREDVVTRAAASGLVALAGSPEAPPAEEFALREDPVLRQAAVWLWARTPTPSRSLGLRFASDPDVLVRRTLADSLTDIQATDGSLAAEIREVLLSDRNVSVRHRAATDAR